MVKSIQIAADQIEVHGDQIAVHAAVGEARIIGRDTIMIEDKSASAEQPVDPNTLPFDEWKKAFDEMRELAVFNDHPADVSREAAYLDDDEIAALDK